ncbi:MAG: DHHA1 domain-containing protein [archaeon]|nr:DHHA1 domain-containing protein [archaeon]
MLDAKQIALLRTELETAQNPLFFYDNDADGLASFLLLYRFCREGKGVIFKSNKKSLGISFLQKVEEIQPDKIFVLDIAEIDQGFIDKANRPIFWLDHHPPQQRNNVHYFNPLINHPGSYYPTTYLAYQVTQNPVDIWIATTGCMADYMIPDFIDIFIEKHPEFLKKKEDLPTMLYKREMEHLVKFFFFIMKGPTVEVHKSIKILTRLKSPNEVFKQESSQGRFLWKRFQKINSKYEEIIKEAKKNATRNKLLLFEYGDDKWSFTTNIANELTVRYPKKVILIARKKSGEMKCSIRAQVPIIEALKNAMHGLQARGGGHPTACGAVIQEADWDEFLKRFTEEIKKLPKVK